MADSKKKKAYRKKATQVKQTKKTVKQIKKEIRAYEKKLKRSYQAMRTYKQKWIRKTEGYQRYQEIFKITKSGTIVPKHPLSKMKKAELEDYLDILEGVYRSKGSTLTSAQKRRREQIKRAKERGASNDLIDFVNKRLDMWDKFINSRTFKDSVGFYAYESSLWDKLRDAEEVDQVTIFKEWLEEREDEWQEYFADAEDLVHYSDYVNNDNWKTILKRLAEEW